MVLMPVNGTNVQKVKWREKTNHRRLDYESIVETQDKNFVFLQTVPLTHSKGLHVLHERRLYCDFKSVDRAIYIVQVSHGGFINLAYVYI